MGLVLVLGWITRQITPDDFTRKKVIIKIDWKLT